RSEQIRTTDVSATSDFTGQVTFYGLSPSTCYHYAVRFGGPTVTTTAQATVGNFTTAPPLEEPASVKFAFSGDIAGHNICRDVDEGFPAITAVASVEDLDFMLILGDSIYADTPCEATGRAGNEQVPGNFGGESTTIEQFWAHYKYNLEDDDYRALLARLPCYNVWDDHEVRNDFGPLYDEAETVPGLNLLPIGLQAFLDYNPFRFAETPRTPKRLYRNVRWGSRAELFILDTRQYRDSLFQQDTEDFPKTMLGREQLTWLKEGLRGSDATWKLVVSSVPLSIATGRGDERRDGWGNNGGPTGYERELEDIITFMRDEDIRNIFFIGADVHVGTAFKYTPFSSGTNNGGPQTEFTFHELLTGPLSAALMPERADTYDRSFNPERLFKYGPDRGNSFQVEYTWEEQKPWFNFGVVDITAGGNLTASILN
ncbi:unnamed protein product, partial [Discosporangium mesarthrocarpum]